MLRLAPDPSDKPRLLDELYPGRAFSVVEWEKCLECNRDVDVFIYNAGVRLGYCNDHYVIRMDLTRC
jgi:hypothetical protein